MIKKTTLYFILLLFPLIGFSQPAEFVILNGSESINVPDSINVIDVTNRTVELWFRVDDAGSSTRQVLYKERASTRGLNIWVESNNLHLGIFNPNNDDTVDNRWLGTWFRKGIVSNRWYHVALVLDNGASTNPIGTDELKWYLDGQLQAQSHGGKLFSDGGNIYLGRSSGSLFALSTALWVSDGNGGEIFTPNTATRNIPDGTEFVSSWYRPSGAIGYSRIWNSARTQAQINDNKDIELTTLNNVSDYMEAYLTGDQIRYVVSGSGGTALTTSDGSVFPQAATGVVKTWKGLANGIWTDTGNWVDGLAPNSGDNVVIDTDVNGTNPTIDVNFGFNDLEITGESSVVAPINLSVSGNFLIDKTANLVISKDNSMMSMNNNVTVERNAKISFKSSSSILQVGGTITNYGIIEFDSSIRSEIRVTSREITNDGDIDLTGSTFSGIDVQKEGITNSGTIIIGDKSYVTLKKTIANTGTFKILSTKEGTGTLIMNLKPTGTGYVIQRFLEDNGAVGGVGKWQLVSSPMSNEESETFYGHFLNWYEALSGGFHAYLSRTEKLNPGQGYVSKLKYEFGNSSQSNPLVFDKSTPNFGNVTITGLINNGAGNTYFDLPVGFNLIGNPYPSNIDFDLFVDSNSNISDTYYYYVDDGSDNGQGGTTPGTSGWKPYTKGDGGEYQYISTGQGFGVICTSTTDADVTFSIIHQKHNYEGGLFGKKNNEIPSIEIIAKANNFVDVSKVRFDNNTEVGFHHGEDTYKLNSMDDDAPTVSFVSEDGVRQYSSVMPETESVPLGFVMHSDGEVEFSINNVEGFREVILEDRKDEEDIKFANLKLDPYSFTHSIGDEEEGRFILHFVKNSLGEVENNVEMKVYYVSNTLNVKSSVELNDAIINLYNVSGQLVFSKEYASLKEKAINLNLSSGIYIVEIKSNEDVSTTRININNL